MEALETKLRVQNRTLKQIKRQGRVALYALYGAGNEYGYEVILIKVHPAQIISRAPLSAARRLSGKRRLGQTCLVIRAE